MRARRQLAQKLNREPTQEELARESGFPEKRVQELLDPSVDRIHFDEAWYAYARFNDLYEGRYGMHRGERHAEIDECHLDRQP